jgi:hypothetical protein
MNTTPRTRRRHLSVVTDTTTAPAGHTYPTPDTIVETARAAFDAPDYDTDRATTLATARSRLADGHPLDAVILDAMRTGFVLGDTTRATIDQHQLRTAHLQADTLALLLDAHADHSALVGA